MDPLRPTRHPPVLDMTPEGEFRPEPAAPGPRGRLDRALARLGGAALLVALAAGGLLLVALALVFVGILLPVLLVASGIAAASLWWRTRRLRRGDGDRRSVRFVVIRR